MTRGLTSGGMALLLTLVVLFGDPGARTSQSVTRSVTPAAALAPAVASVPAICRAPARRGFWPRKASIYVISRHITVLAMGRGRGGVPLPPPLTTSGKRAFAWDKYGPKPGSHRGNVRFNAHTYPDGSALGNDMLRKLWPGMRIIVRGSTTGICYKVTRRITVSPTDSLRGYYNTTGDPKLAIVVCSGRRLGPGRWTSRTIWYARPSTS